MKTVCTIGYHDPQGTRFWVLSTGLKQHGIAVVDCRTTRSGFLPKMTDLWRQAWKTDCEALLVTFPGQYLMPLGWLLGRCKGVPVIFDAFISLHDTMVVDREKIPRRSLRALWLRIVDRMSCLLADRVLLDTPEHAEFFTETIGVPKQKILVIPVGARTDILAPSSQPPRAPGEPLRVLFYGTFIPLQGIDTILQTMEILQREKLPVTLDIVGDGQTGASMRTLARTLGLTNTTFHAPMPLAAIAAMQKEAHCGLGIFGMTPKAQRVIPHKAYDVLACGRPLITADTPAARRMLTHGKTALLVPAGDPTALAQALQLLLANPSSCQVLGEAGAALMHAQYDPKTLTEGLWRFVMASSC